MLFLDRALYGNSLRQWAVAGAVAAISLLLLLLIRRLTVARLDKIARRTTNQFDDLAVSLVARTPRQFLLVVALAIGSRFLALPLKVDDYVKTTFVLILLAQCGLWGSSAVSFWSHQHAERRRAQADATSASTIHAIGIAAKASLWAVVMVTALAKLGVNVTALVTGLGIGGIALALAVQNVLGDLLAALAIIFDKPFDVGDSITVGETSGTVERIGLKTTRLRSVAGEQVIVSNSELLKSRIHNFRRLLERRVVLTLGVTYDTSPDLLARIPEMLEEIVSAEQPVRFERAHFSAFGESALRFETVYFVLDSDYTKYMDIQHSINLAVLQRFDKERIRFAYPTRTVLVEGKS